MDALAHLGEEGVDAFQYTGSRAVALGKRGYAGGMFRARLGSFFATLAQSRQSPGTATRRP